jgi:hypothetical protein
MRERTPTLPFLRRPWPDDALAPLVARALRLANANPPTLGAERAAFYAMKDRLCRRYGDRVGRDWQEIVRECYGCDGSGRYTYPEGDWDECRRCGGDGVYDRFWVELERWEIAGLVFHRPAGRSYTPPGDPVAIVGRIRHARVGWAGREAGLWLALAFDRPLFLRLMTRGGCACGPTWRHPLVTLQKATSTLASLAKRFARRRCVTCGRAFRQGFRHRRSYCCVCRRCDRTAAAAVADDAAF